MTTEQAAAWLAARGYVIAPDTVKRHILRGNLPATRYGTARRGVWDVSEAALTTFLAQRRGRGKPRKA